MAAIGMGPLAVGRYRYWAVPLLRLPPDPYSPAFVQLRELADTHQGLAKRLDALEDKTELLAMQHDTFNRNTRSQLKQISEALRELATPAEPPPPKRPMGSSRMRTSPASPPVPRRRARRRSVRQPSG